MKYLISESNKKGVLVESTPIYVDVQGTAEVSFSLPKEANYVAIFKAPNDIARKVAIKNGVCSIPSALLSNQATRYIDVSVAEVHADSLRIWTCDPLRISSFFAASRSQLHISSGVSDEDYLKRVLELEEENKSLNAKIDELNSKAVEYEKQVSTLTVCINKVVEKHNELVKQFNSYKEEM
jgi:hypothetical protein